MAQEPIKSEQAPLPGEDTLPSPDSASPVTPLPLAQAIRALPRQYFRAVTKPSVVTFSEEMGKASWNIVWVQLIWFFPHVCIRALALRRLSPSETRVAVCGLSPHSSQDRPADRQ